MMQIPCGTIRLANGARDPSCSLSIGLDDRLRSCDPRCRKPALCPAELRRDNMVYVTPLNTGNSLWGLADPIGGSKPGRTVMETANCR